MEQFYSIEVSVFTLLLGGSGSLRRQLVLGLQFFFPVTNDPSRVLRGFQLVLSCEVRFPQRMKIVRSLALGRLGQQERGDSSKDCDTMGVDRGPY